MPQSVTGFLSKDEQFFRTEAEAARHDAELLIRALCDSHNIPRPDALFEIIHEIAHPIREYINADAQCPQPQCQAFADRPGKTEPEPTSPNTPHF